MLKNFLEYIESKKLFSHRQRVLLAVSGGIDSVVMLDLFYRAKLNFGIAHCNFQLRHEESDNDELFVRTLAGKYQVPIFVTRFETASYAEENKISIQMAARDLRYTWFEEIRKNKGYDFIATAHHKGDVMETFFINLARGTGIRGISGIKAKNDKLLRPILFSGRAEIENYATKQQLEFREDSSNASLKYVRNNIRHKIIPAFENLYQNYSNTLIANIERFKDIETVYKTAISEKWTACSEEEKNTVRIDIAKLKKLSPLHTYLFEFLHPYNFSKEVVSDICKGLDTNSGKQFFSHSHRLIKDRNMLIISELTEKENATFSVLANQTSLILHENKLDEISLKMEYFAAEEYKIVNNLQIAALDADKLQFPLLLRKWKAGDYFYPLGMRQRKKLSNFFTDIKLSLLEKESTWLLCSDNDIVWVIGYRIDNRFKLTKNTKRVFKIELL